MYPFPTLLAPLWSTVPAESFAHETPVLLEIKKQQQNKNKIKTSQGKEELRKVDPRALLAQKEEGEGGQL